MKISCKFGEPSWCSFPLGALTPKISTHGSGGGGGVANAKPKYLPDASNRYNYIFCKFTEIKKQQFLVSCDPKKGHWLIR